MREIVYLNQVFLEKSQATISPLDRGFLLADGVYEVIPVHQGRPFLAQEHLERLNRNLMEMEMGAAILEHPWQEILPGLLEKNHLNDGNALIYLQVTRGISEYRAHAFPKNTPSSTGFAMLQPFTPPTIEFLGRGHSAICVPDLRWSRCDIKSIALLGNILSAQKAVKAGAIEAIQIREGFAHEGTKSNLMIVEKNRVITPPDSLLLLPGITRNHLMKLLQAHHISADFEPLTPARLFAADEVWITGSGQDIVPIVSIDGQAIGSGKPGPLWEQAIRWFQDSRRANS